MDLKILILVVSIALMVAIIGLAAAGLAWTVEASPAQVTGARVVLGISAAGAVICLWRIWSTRRERLQR